MKPWIRRWTELPVLWQVIFFLIATLNLSTPFIFKQLADNQERMTDIVEALHKIETDMEVVDGKLKASQEVIPTEQWTIYVLSQDDSAQQAIRFAEDYVEIQLADHSSRIEYEENMDKKDIIESIETQIMQAGLAVVFVTAAITFLFNIFVFLVSTVVSFYLLKNRLRYRILLRLINFPYIIAGLVAILLTIVFPYYRMNYFISLTAMGLITAYILKGEMEKSITDFYFGKGDHIDELY